MTQERGQEAAARAQAAGQRAEELERRLRALRAGHASTPEDVRRAEVAADLEQQRNTDAHERASAAHTRAAEAHERASDMLEAAGRPEQAADHRRRAQLDHEAAVLETAVPETADPSSEQPR